MMLVPVLLALAAEIPSEPNPPQPLRWLYRDSDLVVVAKPGETERLEEKVDGFSAKVVLTVEKILKGKADGPRIPVYYSPGGACPEPDRYLPGRTHLVFLMWRAEIQGYCAPALSFGSKDLDKDSLAVYLRRLEELARIPAEGKDQKPGAETLEWLIRCIERPETRWEGAYEFRLSGPENGESRPPIPIDRLSKEQLKRVVDALVLSPHLTWGDDSLLRMLRDVRDDRITTFLANELRSEYFRGDLHWSYGLMIELRRRLNLEGGKELCDQYINADDMKTCLDAVGKFLELIEKK